MGSTRLPNKVLMEVSGIPLLQYEIDRLRYSKRIDKIILATGEKRENDPIEKLCEKIGIDCFRGSENDVLDRYCQCAKKYPEYENIIRVTGDCPLIDPKIIDAVVALHEKTNNDLTSNVEIETFPDGMDVEVMRRESLCESAEKAKLGSEREHVTQYIRKSDKFKKGNLANPENYSHIRLTVDNKEDFEVIKFLIEHCPPEADFLDYISLLEKNPEVMKKNMHIVRNEGLLKSLIEDNQ